MKGVNCLHVSSTLSAASGGQWFWVANDDCTSKRTFSYLVFLFALAGGGEGPVLPTIIIPAR